MLHKVEERMSITTDLNLIGAEDAGKIRKFKIKIRSTNLFGNLGILRIFHH